MQNPNQQQSPPFVFEFVQLEDQKKQTSIIAQMNDVQRGINNGQVELMRLQAVYKDLMDDAMRRRELLVVPAPLPTDIQVVN